MADIFDEDRIYFPEDPELRVLGKAQQVVRVERVTVNEGGQAVVGDVAYGGGAK